jgi:hypothetical protein
VGRKEEKMKNPEIDIRELAQRIWDIDPYEMKNNDTTPDDIVNAILDDPRETINYLLDIIENA